jgi:hypothetical protein
MGMYRHQKQYRVVDQFHWDYAPGGVKQYRFFSGSKMSACLVTVICRFMVAQISSKHGHRSDGNWIERRS